MRKIPLYEYVATNNSKGAAEVIKHFGLRPPQSMDDVLRGLRHVQSRFGEKGVLEIAKAHPDRQLILATEIDRDKSNFDGGCGHNGCRSTHTCVSGKCVLNKKSTSSACGCSSSFGGDDKLIAPEVKELEILKAKINEEKILKKIEEGKSTLTREDVASEVKKVLDKTNPFIKDHLPYLAVGGLALFFIIGKFK